MQRSICHIDNTHHLQSPLQQRNRKKAARLPPTTETATTKILFLLQNKIREKNQYKNYVVARRLGSGK
jgi:hypothetical protein